MALIEGNNRFVTRHRWAVWTGLLVLAVILLASFMSRGDFVPVRAATAEPSTIRSLIATNGKVEPLNNFEAHAPVATTVKRLLVKEGDHVKKGQLLAELSDAEARSEAAHALAQMRTADAGVHAVQRGGNQEELLTLESELTKARTVRDTALRNLEALKRLQQQGAASAGEVIAAQNELDRANADLSLAQQKQKGRYSEVEIERAGSQRAAAQASYDAAQDVLSRLNIRAPFDGIVYSLPVLQGAFVNTGDLILEEADLSKVRVRAFVDEPDVGRLAAGDRTEVTWDAVRNRTWQGTVSGIPTVIKLHGSRNVGEATCVVDNQDLRLLPNVNVGVTIITAEHTGVLTVPREAIHQEDGKTYVYQIENSELQRRYVQIAISNLTQVEITSGLPYRALVALSPMNGKPLRDGLAVRVVR